MPLKVDIINICSKFDSMNMTLVQRTIAMAVSLVILIVACLAPHGFVFCFGQNGHYAVEPSHDSTYYSYDHDHDRDCLKERNGCGDCSDIPITSFRGKLSKSLLKNIQQRKLQPLAAIFICRSAPILLTGTVYNGIDTFGADRTICRLSTEQMIC